MTFISIRGDRKMSDVEVPRSHSSSFLLPSPSYRHEMKE